MFLPAEWEQHSSCWLAWPCVAELWCEHLDGVQQEFASLCTAINENGGEQLNILLNSEEDRTLADERLGHLNIRFYVQPYGDIWLRDTAPIFGIKEQQLACSAFSFNGWGGKYILPHDAELAENTANLSRLPLHKIGMILEGGALEHNGKGLFITTKECVLNKNRNPNLSEAQAEQILRSSLGAEKIIWIEKGLKSDHTDGHIDNLVRFVDESTVLCMRPADEQDPNRQVLLDIIATLQNATDLEGKKLKVVTIPSASTILNNDGELMPASYMNFYIANKSVVLPIYGSKNDAEAAKVLAELFPTRKIIPLFSRNLLHGGGSFHCITQQVPLSPSGERAG